MGETFDHYTDTAGNEHWTDTETGHHEIKTDFIQTPTEKAAIPLEWIDKHLAWLDICDNDFAQLARVSIRAMVDLWKNDVGRQKNDVGRQKNDVGRQKGGKNDTKKL